ncbi:Cupin domain-containing protein [Anaerosphaera aminiphila DSM 21120]|uniref:Cupin domain-containing protein n=1 Tax=Anaerosphaera aminiphila DSM 21120 TaxID=1120995 RepID=A0A1M5T7C2_9FIRM|nr:cupin domain-containing protein [Anaerosphaera aminiphila]SHH46500.1 Cupin domain-containing protein [Anaerosphaera aminiphila DSM 21120]
MNRRTKNINPSEVLKLSELVNLAEGQVVSKTISQNDNVSITLFAFSKGEEISTHESSGDALVTILEGKSEIVIDGENFSVSEGESILMPAGSPHSLHALEDFKMMLTVVF